jgi:hypothetical protein
MTASLEGVRSWDDRGGRRFSDATRSASPLHAMCRLSAICQHSSQEPADIRGYGKLQGGMSRPRKDALTCTDTNYTARVSTADSGVQVPRQHSRGRCPRKECFKCPLCPLCRRCVSGLTIGTSTWTSWRARAGTGSDQTTSTVWRSPPIQVSRSVWRHEVRSLVGGYRVCVPQLPAVIGDAAVVAGIARQDHWELRGRRRSDRVTTVVNVDRRMRVVIPPRRPTPARSRR